MLSLILGIIGLLAVNVVVGIVMGITGSPNVSGLGYHHAVHDQGGMGTGWQHAERAQASPAGRRPDPVAGRARAGWWTMRAASWLMPPGTAARWVAEADSCMAELPPEELAPVIRSYVLNAPEVVAVSWASFLRRRARRARTGPAS
jgi:hypothetical protein